MIKVLTWSKGFSLCYKYHNAEYSSTVFIKIKSNFISLIGIWETVSNNFYTAVEKCRAQ